MFAAIEACTGAADLAEELIERADWSVHLVHPGYVARIRQSPEKTGFGDARLLADLERVGYLAKVWLAPEWVRDLRRLVRYRRQLADERRNVKLRVSALLREQRIETLGRSWTTSWLAWLKTFDGLTPELRRILIEAAHRLARYDRRWDELKTNLRLAGKPGSVAARRRRQPLSPLAISPDEIRHRLRRKR